MIKVRALHEGFRRGGVAHSTTAKEYPDGFFTDEQLKQLGEDPNIVIEQVATLAPTEEAEQAKKVMMKMTNDKLKSDCDALGIAYDPKATKSDLVDLILANTAPEPEE